MQRKKNETLAKKAATQTQPLEPSPPPIKEQTRQPFRSIPSQSQNYFNTPPLLQEFVLPNQIQSNQQFQPQIIQQQQAPPRRLTNTSTSSVASSTKNVRWSSPIAEHLTISSINESFNFSSLRIYIPEDVELIHEIDNPLFIEEQYLNFGNYRIMKDCGCESIRYDNGDLQYCCLTDVNVNVSFDLNSYNLTLFYFQICYFEENGQLTVTLPGGYVVNTFQSMQLEIIREQTDEKSIVIPNGIRYEYYTVPNQENQARDKIFNKDEGERRTAEGKEEILVEPVTVRSEKDYVEQYDDHIAFFCPGFTVSFCFGFSLVIVGIQF